MSFKKLLRDNRLLFVVFFIPILSLIFLTDSDNRPINFLLTSIIVGTSVDFLLHLYFRKIFFVPFSGLITSLGIFVVNQSPEYTMYAMAVALAIFSKHFIRYQGRHIFNPTNFGAVVAWFYFPTTIVPSTAPWSDHYWMTAILAIAGFILAKRARRLALVLSYLVCFLAIAIVKVNFLGDHLVIVFSSLYGATGYLFLFFMITDPVTTPSCEKQQLVFGITLGIIDQTLKSLQIIGAPLISLFFVTILYSLLRPLLQKYFSISPRKATA